MESQNVTPVSVNKQKLEDKVKAMYTGVAQNPHGDFHFAMGKALALRLGYQEDELAPIPNESVDSFGIGYPFVLADIKPGESILDLGADPAWMFSWHLAKPPT